MKLLRLKGAALQSVPSKRGRTNKENNDHDGQGASDAMESDKLKEKSEIRATKKAKGFETEKFSIHRIICIIVLFH